MTFKPNTFRKVLFIRIYFLIPYKAIGPINWRGRRRNGDVERKTDKIGKSLYKEFAVVLRDILEYLHFLGLFS